MRNYATAVFLVLVCFAGTSFAGVPGFMKARMGTLEGQFFSGEDKPHADGIVSFFNVNEGPPPIVGSARRVPDLVARTDAKGNFSAKLLPGTYYMGALVRDADAGPGPPREGETYFFAMAAGEKLKTFEVKTKQVSNVGRVDGLEPEKFSEFKDFVVIEGEVLDQEGKPVSGMMITVKAELNEPRPKYISERTKEDGRFQLKLPPGRYFVMARESLQSGRPRPGSYIGTYGKSAPETSFSKEGGGAGKGVSPGLGVQGSGGEAIAIDAKPGQTYSNISIKVYKIPDPEETRRNFEEEARIRKENSSQQKGRE